MSVSTTLQAPSSFQFRLANANGRKSPSVHLPIYNLHRQVRRFSASKDNGKGNVTEQLTVTNSNFSGWLVENNASQKVNDSKPKLSWASGGMVGVILVAGLSYAVFSINKNILVPKQIMEPWVTHQEELMSSADENDNSKDDGGKEDNIMLDDKHSEGKTGIYRISFTYKIDSNHN